MSNEEYVTYEQAKVLKAAGFDYECDYHFSKEDAPGGLVWGIKSFAPANHNANGYLSIPTLAQAAKWLREKKNLHISINCQNKDEWSYAIFKIGETSATNYGINNKSYEAALSAGVTLCLGIINDKTE